MLLLIRKSRWARALVLGAGLFSVCSGFGLHAEPASGASDASAVPAWAAGDSIVPATHSCPACLAHRPLTVAPADAVCLRPAAGVLRETFCEVFQPERPAARQRRDRAPPSLS